MGKAFKLRRLNQDVADVLATSPNQSAAARRLGVDRSTVHRWLKDGKVQPSARPKRGGGESAALSANSPSPVQQTELRTCVSEVTPEQWMAAARADYDFSPTEEVLVDQGGMTLRLSQDERLTASERLAAIGRFQQIVKQLRLEEAEGGEAKTRGERPWPRRVG